MGPLLAFWSHRYQNQASSWINQDSNLLFLKNARPGRGALSDFHSANNSGFTKTYTGNNFKSELWWKVFKKKKNFLGKNAGCFFCFVFYLLYHKCHGKFKHLQVWVSRIKCACLMCFCSVNPQEICERRYLVINCWLFICLCPNLHRHPGSTWLLFRSSKP